MLHKLGESCISTNGFLSSFFNITRSMWQGCPIAAYLYILQAEPMAQTIRKSIHIKGIDLPSPVDEKLDSHIEHFFVFLSCTDLLCFL